MEPFPRRCFRSPGHFFSSLGDILGRFRRRSGPIGDFVDTAFRQRLWLAVTDVNNCRYCIWVHTRLALRSGVPAREVDALCSGRMADSPAEQRQALLYARQWAEQEGLVDREARDRLVETYGEERAQAIETVLHLVRLFNLMGNTWDFMLYKVSGGRLDVHRHYRAPAAVRQVAEPGSGAPSSDS